jgi:hypothetical protein
MAIEITEKNHVFYGGEDEGKPTGDKTYFIHIDGKIKGSVFYSKYCEKEATIGAYSVYSVPIFGSEYKSKRFKTFTGAKNFIINSKIKYDSLVEAINKTTE